MRNSSRRFLARLATLASLVVLASPAGRAGEPSSPPATAPKLTGSVKKAGGLEPLMASLPRHVRFATVPGEGGGYRATIEAEGVSLKELLERAEVAKQKDDGFGRPLDLSVVVVGRDGRKALFSWGELFLGADEGAALLADRMRPFVPHHHADLKEQGWSPAPWLDRTAREKLDVTSCASCHDGKAERRIEVPRGLCLVPLGDRTGRRFVEDVVEVEVRQAGFDAPPRRRGDEFDPWVAEPVLVLPDGTRQPLTETLTKGLPRVSWEADRIGLGRGFRGRSRSAGSSLASLLWSRLPAGTDPGRLAIVVTASDGYRALYSGGEVLLSRLPENVALVDTLDGKPLERRSGRIQVAPRGDFFVDRDVRSVAEIRCLVVP